METTIKEILKKENINFSKIEKATSGFTNLVYFVDNLYVIKISNNEENTEKLIKEINIYKNLKINKIPKLICSGTYNDFTYLIISKIDGKSLFDTWHTFDEPERKNIIKQIADILKSFHNESYAFLNDNYKFLSWNKYISNEIKTRIEELKNLNQENERLKTLYENNFYGIFENNDFGLVYNDAHFDNFIYNNGTIYLIDFDRVIACPKDYEMMIFKLMYDLPLKFASEENEIFVKEEDYVNIYPDFQKYYPELFKNENTSKRIAIYQLNYMLKQAYTIKNIEVRDQIIRNSLNNYLF